MQRLPLEKISVMLDSGAFSSWRSGAKLDLYAYIDFVKRYHDLIDLYVNLDVIPGRPNETPTPTEVANSVKQGNENLRYMIANGLHPLPVFHQGEEADVLKQFISKHDYIGLAPHASEKVKRRWLDNVFGYITRTGAKIKTHGFGVTSTETIFRYPWTSCDSTSWAKRAAYGWVVVPPTKNGSYDYSVSPKSIGFSDRGVSSMRYSAYCGKSKDYLDGYVARYSTTVETLFTDSEERARLNAEYYLEVEKRSGVKIFLVGDFSAFKVLNRTSSRHRLVSYYSIKNVTRTAFENAVYMRTTKKVRRLVFPRDLAKSQSVFVPPVPSA